MTFIEPSLKEVFDTLINNNELINYLQEKEYLLTRAMLYDTYTVEQIREMERAIYVDNVETLYNLAQVLLDNSKTIKSNDIWYLTSNLIAYDKIAAAFGLDRDSFSVDAYRLIVYTYKFCTVSSFFQNNRESFLTSYDFNEIENTPILKGFLDALLKEFDKLDIIIGKCAEYHDFDKIPYDLINYLTQLLGFEKATINADDTMEAKYREIVRNIIDIYRIKGTNFSFELLFRFLGYSVTIKEFYFDRRYYFAKDQANEHTNISEKKSYLYYMSVEPPCDNKLEITNNERVGFKDYTKQYNLDEFSLLADKYGVEAVLGYSKYDTAGKLYTGKVYKYFKSNLVYYTINLDKNNPSEKQLTQINKILAFLTPAYIIRSTNISVYTGSNSNAPGDNMIFFDDNRYYKDTIENLQKDVEDSEEGYKYIQDVIRDTYPIMLDSEMRDDGAQPKGTNRDLYLDMDGNILHDNTQKTPYINTINTTTFKPVLPFRTSGKLYFNRFSGSTFNMLQIKNISKNSNNYQDVTLTDLSVEDYLKTKKLSFSRSSIDTLTLMQAYNLTDLPKLQKQYDWCLQISGDFSPLPNFIAPSRLGKENVAKLVVAKHVFVVSGSKVGVYKYGAVPQNNKNYDLSFTIKLIKTQKLYRSINKKININVPNSLKIEKTSLEALYDAALAKTSSEALNYYYFNSSENYWYYPIKKAYLLPRIETTNNKKTYLMINNYVLPISDDYAKEYGIPKIFKSEGKYGSSMVTTVYDTPEECFKSMDIEIYNNFMFYVEDLENDYESDLYKFTLDTKNEYVYSTKTEEFYYVSQDSYEKLDNFFGRLEISENSAKLYNYDESWYGYDEIDDFDNFIFYNHPHRIIWSYIGYDKVISRPIKALTDKEITEDLKDALINEIFYSTFPYFSAGVKNEIYKLGNWQRSGEILNDIKNKEVFSEDVLNYLEEKSQKRDTYNNLNDNFRLLYEFLSAEDLDEFVKWYYYDKLTKLYREAYLQDIDSSNDVFFKISTRERIPLYETLNGNVGILGKPNTLLQSRKNNKSLNLKYSIRNNAIFVEKEELIKNKMVNMIRRAFYLAPIRNITLNYKMRSVFIHSLSTTLDPDNNLIIYCALPDDVENGTLQVNNTKQLLSDNKINAHTSSYLRQDEFVTCGDDRVFDVSGTIEEDVSAVIEDDEITILLNNKDLHFEQLKSVDVTYTDDRKVVQFNHVQDFVVVAIKNASDTKFTILNTKNVKTKFSVNIEGVDIVEK